MIEKLSLTVIFHEQVVSSSVITEAGEISNHERLISAHSVSSLSFFPPFEWRSEKSTVHPPAI